jgi:hypothetical protein
MALPVALAAALAAITTLSPRHDDGRTLCAEAPPVDRLLVDPGHCRWTVPTFTGHLPELGQEFCQWENSYTLGNIMEVDVVHLAARWRYSESGLPHVLVVGQVLVPCWYQK